VCVCVWCVCVCDSIANWLEHQPVNQKVTGLMLGSNATSV